MRDVLNFLQIINVMSTSCILMDDFHCDIPYVATINDATNNATVLGHTTQPPTLRVNLDDGISRDSKKESKSAAAAARPAGLAVGRLVGRSVVRPTST
jgi:hypothetical protein